MTFIQCKVKNKDTSISIKRLMLYLCFGLIFGGRSETVLEMAGKPLSADPHEAQMFSLGLGPGL